MSCTGGGEGAREFRVGCRETTQHIPASGLVLALGCELCLHLEYELQELCGVHLRL